jgi:hypothetical protein
LITFSTSFAHLTSWFQFNSAFQQRFFAMASSGSLFSETLHDITTTKLVELSKKYESFEREYSALLAAVRLEEDPLERLFKLVDGVKSCFSVKTSVIKGDNKASSRKFGPVISGSTNNPRLETDLKNLDRFLEQARYDPSVSAKLLREWQETLLQHLSVQSLRLQYATLYGQLVTEWLASEKEPEDSSAADVEMAEVFEQVPSGKKLESRAAWERDVFEEKVINKDNLGKWLDELFGFNNESKRDVLKAFKILQGSVEAFEHALATPQQFNQYTLGWTIRGLLGSDVLTDEKRAVLKDFSGNPVILSEIADVLNMRMAALDAWSWGGDVSVEQRRQLNGTYNIYLHEDLLQAIFLQFIGVKWAVFFKRAFKTFRRQREAWKSPRASIPILDRRRRDYYLGPQSTKDSVQTARRSIHRKDYFVSQLPDSELQDVIIEEGDDEAEITEEFSAPRAKQTAKKKGSRAAHRSLDPTSAAVSQRMLGDKRRMREETRSDSESDDDNSNESKRPMEAKQTLLHLLSTEIAINTRVHGELTAIRSVFDQWNPWLPHTSVLTVLEFFGISKKWLSFFQKFLQAPLKFIDEKSSQSRIRKRGCPASHALSDVFGETILFCLDFSVNQTTDGALLYRMHDDFWFWSPDHAKCVTVWKAITQFTDVMGVHLSKAKTGAVRVGRDLNKPLKLDPSLPTGQVRWGFLYLDQSGRFEIDQSAIDSHIEELRRQLHGKKCVFSWIQAWNTYAATFFTYNFGKSANCFGRDHVDKMLATHQRVHKAIFATEDGENTGSVVQYLKAILEQRFGVKNVPDGFFFFPVELGGLDLRSPFVTLMQIREAVLSSPSNLLDEFEEAEAEAYRLAKQRFEKGDISDERYSVNEPNWVPEKDKDVFMPFEEYVRYREEYDYGYTTQLFNVFNTLLQRPIEESIEPTAKIENALANLSGQQNLNGIISYWYGMEPYYKWISQMYGPEMIDRFGGFAIIEPGLLPIGMVSLFRGKRVGWND